MALTTTVPTWPARASQVQVCEGVDPMGRGRAKAKQTKVARDLKYRTYETDFDQLQRELHGDGDATADSSDEVELDRLENDVDPYDDPESARSR